MIADLAKSGKLQSVLAELSENPIIDQLFRAEAQTYLSRYEEALPGYRKLAELYPHDREFTAKLVNLTRSFGQKEKVFLTEAVKLAQSRADFEPSNSSYRTISGEIKAELNDYQNANLEWQKLIATGKGDGQTYLETAGVYWDYFQYDEALRIIENYRQTTHNPTIYAFEAGAILEARHKQTQALNEYFNALYEENSKARNRLEKLGKSANGFQTIDSVFRRQKNSDWKTLNYALVLQNLEKKVYAANLLTNQIKFSKDSRFLEAVRDNFTELKPEVFARQAKIVENPRRKISFQLRLADHYRNINQPQKRKPLLTI